MRASTKLIKGYKEIGMVRDKMLNEKRKRIKVSVSLVLIYWEKL